VTVKNQNINDNNIEKSDAVYLRPPIKRFPGDTLKNEKNEKFSNLEIEKTTMGNKIGDKIHHIHTYMDIYTCIYVNSYVYIYMCMYVCTYRHMHIYTCIYISISIYIYTYIYIYL
jgi:hypothetical protein